MLNNGSVVQVAKNTGHNGRLKRSQDVQMVAMMRGLRRGAAVHFRSVCQNNILVQCKTSPRPSVDNMVYILSLS